MVHTLSHHCRRRDGCASVDRRLSLSRARRPCRFGLCAITEWMGSITSTRFSNEFCLSTCFTLFKKDFKTCLEGDSTSPLNTTLLSPVRIPVEGAFVYSFASVVHPPLRGIMSVSSS